MSNRDPSHWKDSNDSSPESSMCDCQSQLKHYDMIGNPHKDLRDACKRSMGIPVEDAPPVEDVPPVEGASATESDPEWGDFKQEHCKINQFESSKLIVLQ
jgi:hypothetical protein